jgi:ribosomal protein L16/L10AE
MGAPRCKDARQSAHHSTQNKRFQARLQYPHLTHQSHLKTHASRALNLRVLEESRLATSRILNRNHGFYCQSVMRDSLCEFRKIPSCLLVYLGYF